MAHWNAIPFLFLSTAAMVFGQVEAPPSPKVKLYMPYKEYSLKDNQNILKMFDDVRVADVSDGMDVVGLAGVGIVNPEIKALWRLPRKCRPIIAGWLAESVPGAMNWSL
jgi:hypothetical protein